MWILCDEVYLGVILILNDIEFPVRYNVTTCSQSPSCRWQVGIRVKMRLQRRSTWNISSWCTGSKVRRKGVQLYSESSMSSASAATLAFRAEISFDCCVMIQCGQWKGWLPELETLSKAALDKPAHCRCSHS